MKLSHEELEKVLGEPLTDTEYEVINAACSHATMLTPKSEDYFIELLTDKNNRRLVEALVYVACTYKMSLDCAVSEEGLKECERKSAIFKHSSRLLPMNGRLVYFRVDDGDREFDAYGRLYEEECTRVAYLCNDYLQGAGEDMCPGKWGYKHALRLNIGAGSGDVITPDNLSDRVLPQYSAIRSIVLVQPGSVHQYEYTDYHVGDILSLRGSSKADMQVISRSGSLVVCNNLRAGCATTNYTVKELSDSGVLVWVPDHRNWMDLHEEVYAELFGLWTRPRLVGKS